MVGPGLAGQGWPWSGTERLGMVRCGMPLWPHQVRAIEAYRSAIRAGNRRVALTIPTGGGKTRILAEIIKKDLESGLTWTIYTNRRMLVDQLSDVLGKQGIRHGVRAATYRDERELAVQVSSIATVWRRCFQRPEHIRQTLHQACGVAVDECHLHLGTVSKTILDAHAAQGAVILGLSATPLGLAGKYDVLLQPATNSELRKCGALVPAFHYGPDEPIKVKAKLGQDPTEAECRKAVMRAGIFGRVIEHYRRLNPEQKPTILFAPGVPESVGFAEAFSRAGIPAAHVDGEDVWIEGKWYKADLSARKAVMDGSRSGEVRVVCNRFVLREGVDAPWLEVGIFATVFGSVGTYLQSGGRLLRASPGKSKAVVIDHGGNWHRHGSLNADRVWELGDTPELIAGLREDDYRYNRCFRCHTAILGVSEGCKVCGAPAVRPPYRCPQCTQILNTRFCPCGYEIPPGKRSRVVVQHDGTLHEHFGDVYKPRRVKREPDTVEKWKKMYYRARASRKGMTFRQAVGLFAVEHRYWPPLTLPLMPAGHRDWYLPVKSVPSERLR